MEDLYRTLGVAPDASSDQIKQAYRLEVFRHHPDTNPDAGEAARARFHEVQEAYSVLRDEVKRAQYDRMRAAGFGDVAAAQEAGFTSTTPWGQPSPMDEKAWDAWWQKMTEEFSDFEEGRFARERATAERRAKAAAWEWEKEQAQLNKVRAQRLKWRTEDARLARHAATLRRFWQTRAGFTPADALFLGVCLTGVAGIALTWRSHLRHVRQQQQQRGQAPCLPAAAAAPATP